MKRKHLRGSTTAGRGYGKRARHAGNRGGRGKAGGGKRGQQKLMSVRANKHTYWTSDSKKTPLNLNRIRTLLNKLEREGTLSLEEGRTVIKLKDLGYSKVCGSLSKDKVKLAIYGKASERAKQSILEAGGTIYE
ncbi:uL15 family ribosomal protein [Candidatus Parvarchaeota archaeon]|nr:uL15 family ribosomal protein [Candidatus Parvarchaeota archaeon]